MARFDVTATLSPSIHAAAPAERALLAEDGERALTLHHDALRIRATHRLTPGCIDSLECVAGLMAERGRCREAGALLGAADRARADTGYQARPELQQPAVIAGSCPSDAIAAGRAMDLPDAIALAQRTRGPRRRPDSGWASLTPTEQSVATLAAQA